jgi:hypothetical protein
VRTEQQFRECLHRANVPEQMHDSYVRYLLHGIEPGDFLVAVLANDLREACGRADDDNRKSLYNHVFFLHNYAPMGCWGSPEHVSEWIAQHRQLANAERG